MSDDRLRQARYQRDWLETRRRTRELVTAEQEAKTKVAKAIDDLVQISIARADAQREEDIRSRRMLGE